MVFSMFFPLLAHFPAVKLIYLLLYVTTEVTFSLVAIVPVSARKRKLYNDNNNNNIALMSLLR